MPTLGVFFDEAAREYWCEMACKVNGFQVTRDIDDENGKAKLLM